MKLSEAIRLGAMLKSQGFGQLVDYRSTVTCAIGAAVDACGRLSAEHSEEVYEFARTQWPQLSVEIPHPVTGRIDTLSWAIVSLNDLFGWTREQIADWVATIEAQHEQQAQPEPTAVQV